MNQPPLSYSSSEAIPLPSDHDLGFLHAQAVKLSGDLNVSRTLAGTGNLFLPAAAFVKALFSTGGIDPKIRELIVLRSAKLLDCPYEWQANAAMAKNAGCTPTEIDAMASDGPVTGLGEEITLILSAVDELTKDATLTDETLAAMRARYDDELVRKYLLMIGWFNLLSRFLNGCRVPLESGDKIGGKTSPV